MTYSFVALDFSTFSNNADLHFYFSEEITNFGLNKLSSLCK